MIAFGNDWGNMQIINQAIRPPSDWWGSFELYQNPQFAEIIARHYHSDVINVAGLVIMAHRIPVLGYMEGTLGCPELVGSYAHWWPKAGQSKFSYLKILTSEYISPWTDYLISPPDNYYMGLDLYLSEEELYKHFNKKCRESIRIGARKGITVREAQDEPDIQKFYAMCLKISQNNSLFQLPPYALVREIFYSSFGKLFLAIGQGQIVGGLFFLLGRHMTAWIGGFDRDFTHLSPSNVMHWECIQWGKAHNFRFYDMGPQSLSQNKNLTRFKMSFNPVLLPSYFYRVPITRGKIIFAQIKDFFTTQISKRESLRNLLRLAN